MGYELKVRNDRGEVMNLSKSKHYKVFKVTGLQPPQATIYSSNNATADGVTISSTRIGTRNIVIYMTIEGDVEVNRINLYKYFPVKKTVTLYFRNGSRDVYIEGTVELIECDLFTQKQIAQISIICPQPYFKAVDEIISHFSSVVSMFEFPFAIPEAGMEFSAVVTNERKSIINTGDIEGGIIISLYAAGEVVNPIVYDVFERTHIGFNFTMAAGDEIIINTNAGRKSVMLIRGGVQSNIIGYMKPDSTWFTLKTGDNVFTYDTDSGNSNLLLTFTTAVLYGGV